MVEAVTCRSVLCLAAQAARYMWSQCQPRQQASTARAAREGDHLRAAVARVERRQRRSARVSRGSRREDSCS